MDTKALILQYLQAHKLMVVATTDANQPWCCSVFYAVDPNLSLYFMSSDQSRHIKNIQANPSVAVLITDPHQNITSKKIGMQMEGSIEVVRKHITGEEDEHIAALDLWITSVGGFEKKEIFKLASVSAMVGTLYKITPKMIRYLNEELFGDYGFQTLTLKGASPGPTADVPAH